MIVICVIIAIIGSFIYTLIKISINEWLVDSSMKRLSLKRSRYEYETSQEIEISDDDSFDASSLRKNTEYNACTSKLDYNTINVPNSLTDISNYEPNIHISGSNFVHDVSNNSSIDDDVHVIEEIPTTSDGKSSMFNWNKNMRGMPQYENASKSNTLFDSRFIKKMPMESCNKKQHLTSCNKSCNKKQQVTSNLTDSNDEYDWNNTKREDSPPKVTIHYDEMIAGVKVKFPIKPYLCQKAVMNNLIRGCIKEENCLIESPTGSGKTLALLCGSLAWQEQYSENILKEILKEGEKQKQNAMDSENLWCAENDASCTLPVNTDDKACDRTLVKRNTRLPRIFYGTRTHRQVEQVVRELKKTAYKDKRMTILSSREHTCIQDTNRNKTELCNELLDPKKLTKCKYYNERNKKEIASFEAVEDHGLKTPWDIEDFVGLGKQVGACPYFAARSLMADAEIIMCPYNYLIDPNIRESMQINLKNDIVILDEAHNIEDFCREAASVDIKDVNLISASKECEKLSHLRNVNKYMYITIHSYLQDLVNFLQNVDVKEVSNDNQQGMVSEQWLGMDFLILLDVDKIGRSRFPNFSAASKAAIEDFNDITERLSERSIPTISLETKIVLELLCFVMEKMTSDIFVNDYRAYVVEAEEFKTTNTKAQEDTWISRNKRERVRTLKLVCMNPAVVFEPLSRITRSVILASGTLAPTSSFESELGTRFPHKLHANHIIPREQVYVRCIPRGPNGESLLANYKNVNSWSFQDELGKLIVQVCDAIPYGVLCFFSSYSAMNKIHMRWKDIGIWAKLAELKEIFVEPKENRELPEIMREYREVIKESSSKSFRERSGAILFAVFRGKVAEGIDFSDNEARCVLTVGIPFTSIKNVAVAMKKDYNDSNMSKGLLSGSEWYTINAFRALNQALGRCIRHINDWGAVLLVDERFLQRPKNADYLPKWIKEMQNKCNIKDNLKVELENFVARQVAREKGRRYLEEKARLVPNFTQDLYKT
ncbi:Fanconi anemia group J protein homolog [Harpegnathos saltator]|uniref:Fanconi anemia group J protein homolog n=1 Tax=Harpegnathos saltator TaxID=610380 RepID=UPI000590F35F|nr:Fanconi anemia group J protein homolog [Harpegnathos saltator]